MEICECGHYTSDHDGWGCTRWGCTCTVKREEKEKTCPNKIPEPHILGEFPMTCTPCHTEADS